MSTLCRESELVCGTDSTPMDGTACEVTYIIYRHQLTHADLCNNTQGGPGSDTQRVCGMCGVLYDMSWPTGVGLFKH